MGRSGLLKKGRIELNSVFLRHLAFVSSLQRFLRGQPVFIFPFNRLALLPLPSPVPGTTFPSTTSSTASPTVPRCSGRRWSGARRAAGSSASRGRASRAASGSPSPTTPTRGTSGESGTRRRTTTTRSRRRRGGRPRRRSPARRRGTPRRRRRRTPRRKSPRTTSLSTCPKIRGARPRPGSRSPLRRGSRPRRAEQGVKEGGEERSRVISHTFTHLKKHVGYRSIFVVPLMYPHQVEWLRENDFRVIISPVMKKKSYE